MKSYHDIPSDGGSDIVGQVTAQAARVKARLADVRHVVAVMSGKGGVGKSTVTVLLAGALARRGWRVGLLDADINGPSLARMTGTHAQTPRTGPDGMQPALADHAVRVMSMDLFLPDAAAPVEWDAPTQRDAFTWRGMMEAGALREFVADTAWGRLDVLLVDLPPGADRLPTLHDVCPSLAGAVVVTLPSGVSRFVVGKSIRAAERLGTPVFGVVENMSGYRQPDGTTAALFPGAEGAALAAAHDLPLLGRLPFDPTLAAAADAGRLLTAPAGPAADALADALAARLDALSHPTAPEP